MQYAEKATRLNPNGALGFDALAWCHSLNATYGWGKSHDQSLSGALDAAKRAVALDNGDALAHEVLGRACLYSRRHREAIRRLERAIALNPNYAAAHGHLGYARACLGESARSITAIQDALRLSPLERERGIWFSIASFAEFASERYDEGIEWAQRGVAENPDWPGTYRVLAANCGQAGQIEAARVAIAELKRVAPDITIETTRQQILGRPRHNGTLPRRLAQSGLAGTK